MTSRGVRVKGQRAVKQRGIVEGGEDYTKEEWKEGVETWGRRFQDTWGTLKVISLSK